MPAAQAQERIATPWPAGLLDRPGQLFPHVRPIVSLRDGTVHGYEELLRARAALQHRAQELLGARAAGLLRAANAGMYERKALRRVA
jgi:EAL domain-containing protein (putative c-di-GMP-specific phosphodiesterase class I)